MTSIGSPSPFFLAGKKAYEVERSLRFNSGDNTYLARTPSSTTSRTTWTYSTWIKKTSFGSTVGLFGTNGSDNNTNTELLFTSANKFSWQAYSKVYFQTNQVFLDPSAWFHLLVRCDTTNSTQADRLQLWINGSRVTSFATENLTGSGTEFGINRNVDHRIGERPGGSDNFNGYLAEMHFVDGTALDSSSFTETDAITGQLIAKKYVGSYGTNGFYLNFSDNSGTTATTLGKDSSGNSNNFTPNNFVTGDAVKDSPTNNFSTLNVLDRTVWLTTIDIATLSEGNLKASGSNNKAFSSIGIEKNDTNKYYAEMYVNSNDANNYSTLIVSQQNASVFEVGYNGPQGTKQLNRGTATSYGATFDAGDVIGVLVDRANNQVTFYKNNASQGTISNTFSTTSPNDIAYIGAYYYGNVQTFNFGQDSTFAGAVSSGGNTDANGIGDFKYAVPSGAKALCSANLPDPTILLPNKHFDTKLFTGNGSSQTISGLNFAPDWVWIKNRNSSSARSHILTDRIRGATKSLLLPETDVEATQAQDLSAFTSDGFTVGNYERVNENSKNLVAWNWNAGETDSATYTVKVVSDSGNKYRFNNFGTSAVTLDLAEGGTYTFDGSDSSMSGHPFVIGTAANGTVYSTGVTYQLDGVSVTYSAYTSGYASASTRKLIITVPASAPVLYYWCSIHSGMGGQINTNSTLGSSNFDGSTQSVVKVNATAGFSIVGYTGNGSTATIGHGLGVAPNFYVVKERTDTSHWYAYSKELGGDKELRLNATLAASTNDKWQDTNPTASIFYLGQDTATNQSSQTYITYAFSEVAGYSKFGSYTGNGNADGTFVFTGFRPAWILIKRTDSASEWSLFDTARKTFNVGDLRLEPNSSSVEDSNSVNYHDILSNGFKMRNSDAARNGSGATYIYLAFAESPFKNARAR